MLPQLGFSEILVLSLLAIIVVGPKDLPKLMRKIGQIMTKVRAMGQEFTNAFNEMGAEDEIAEMRKELADLRKMGSMEHLSEKFETEIQDIDRDLRGAAAEASETSSNPKAAIKPDVVNTDTAKPSKTPAKSNQAKSSNSKTSGKSS
jgi:sec-independent protein translocase protein TatB